MMNALEIKNSDVRQAIVLKVYDTLKGMRVARTRYMKSLDISNHGEFRNGAADAVCFSFDGLCKSGDYRINMILLAKDTNIQSNAAHEFTHAAIDMVRYGNLRLLARDSKIKKQCKREEATATIVGSLMTIFNQWMCCGLDTNEFISRGYYPPDLFPQDLWKL